MYAEDQARSTGARAGRAPARRPQAESRTLPGLLSLQSTAGNAAAVQMLRRAGHSWAQERHQQGAHCDHQQAEHPVQRSPAPVQRTLYMDSDRDKRGLTRQEVLSADWYKELHSGHQQRMEPYIDHENHVAVGEVIEFTRNTVVGAVDGRRKEDTEFLTDAWHRKQNLNAYDLAMQEGRLQESLGEWGIPQNTTQLTKGSITGFGHHVPHTDVLVPHPGNIWSMADAPNGLAHCLESIMGANSKAWIFTDNDQGVYSQAEAIRTAINGINQDNSGDKEYIPLAVEVTQVSGVSPGSTYKLAGAPLVIGHQPPYRLVTVTRR